MAESVTELPWVWGIQVPAGERPPGLPPAARRASRAVRSSADPEQLWLWLCQLRRAPYSYDLLDNLGRRSPRRADPSLTTLVPGQRVMTIFDLIAVEPGRSFWLRMRPGLPTLLFGAIEGEYRISPTTVTSTDAGAEAEAGAGAEAEAEAGAGTGIGTDTLLSVVLWMPPLPGPLGAARRYLLAWGDVLMMRKQLRTLARLAEGA